MRQFKFRAWDKENETMTYPKGILFDGRIVNFSCGMLEAFEGYEIMQYAGLKDKNGVEIYEGDLYQNLLGSKMKIIFEIREASFMGKSLKTGQIFSLLNFNGSLNGEVIGNIYENPELLEGEE